MSKRHYIIPIFVPHRGCPHDCVFCNQRKITGLSTDITKEQVRNTIEEYLKTIPKTNVTIEVAFFGGSFTGIKKEIQIELLETANAYKRNGHIDKIRLSTRPDYINVDILNMLKENGVDIIELGVQSLDQDVLVRSKRGHTIEDVFFSAHLIKDNGFILGLQMMVGLPGDNRQKTLSTTRKIAGLSPDFVRVYPTLVIRETYLQRMTEIGDYKPLKLDEAVDVCSDILMIFHTEGIPVIRLGLQPTDNVSLNKDVIAGPFHPSIRQLVEAEIYKRILIEFLNINNITNEKIIIEANKGEISNLVGQKSSNIRLLKRNYGFKKIKIVESNIDKEFFYIYEGDSKYKIELNKYIDIYIGKYLKG